MLIDNYVSFEIAKMLKEKGFDEPSYKMYYQDHKGEYHLADDAGHTNSMWEEMFKRDGVMNYSAPTIYTVVNWLDSKGYYISVVPYDFSVIPHDTIQSANNITVRFSATIYKHINDEYNLFDNMSIGIYNSRKEALEESIKKCLNKI